MADPKISTKMDFIIYSKHTFCYDWDVAVILKITWGKLIIEM